jgi:2-keto-4-pentenoate hydratase/2-oxohepta-3-ene-1,7-dioic acid hydratase in catechol pathway
VSAPGEAVGVPRAVGAIWCIGRNYAEHAAELGNAVPEAPVIFLKSAGALGPREGEFALPPGEELPHHETELVLRIGRGGFALGEVQARAAIAAVAVGLDLTLRATQSKLKEKGLPWVRAKSFRDAALISAWAEVGADEDLGDLSVELDVNGSLRQRGHVREMLWKPAALVAEVSRLCPLQPGDVIFTGTPKGVAEIRPGDRLDARVLRGSAQLVGSRWTAR